MRQRPHPNQQTSSRPPVDLSPLGAARTAFIRLTSGDDSLALDTTAYPGLPDRPVVLSDLRTRLLSQSCPPATRDAVWREMVTRSRTRGEAWTIGCVGLAMPALTTLASQLSACFAGDRSDVHAEILRGFLTALTDIDLDRPAIMTRLRWAAYRAGHAAVREALDAPMPSVESYHSSAPQAPYGHPDLVLARAVTEAVLTTIEADLIGATRLEHIRLRVWATEHGASYEAARKARQRAERRLVAWLREEMTVRDFHAEQRPEATTPPLRLVPPLPVADIPRSDTAVSPNSARAGVQRCAITAHPAPATVDRGPTAHPEAPRCA
jgi:hypothetical protein